MSDAGKIAFETFPMKNVTGMDNFCDPTYCFELMEELLEDPDTASTELFEINDELVAEVANYSLAMSGIPITVEQIKNNKELMRSFKTQLIDFKNRISQFIKDVEETKAEAEDNVKSSIEKTSKRSGFATALKGTVNQYTSGLTQVVSQIQKSDFEGDKSDLKSTVLALSSKLKIITANAGGILSIASRLGIGVPLVFATTLGFVVELKNAVLTLKDSIKKLDDLDKAFV